MRRHATAALILCICLLGASPAAAQNRGKGYAEALEAKAAAQRAADRRAAQAREKRRDAAAVAHFSRRYGSRTGRWAGIVNDYFHGRHIGEAMYVIHGESGGRPRADNGMARGLFQVHEIHARAFRRITGKPYFWGVFSPRANIRFAAYLSWGGRDWSAWAVRP